ncbi:hypothetical protein JF66_01640 [Cryobacterium sp. MLB-32]|nr:hypothetical protein JF66_01640 [Cryobacterium sp. MLB-32]
MPARCILFATAFIRDPLRQHRSSHPACTRSTSTDHRTRPPPGLHPISQHRSSHPASTRPSSTEHRAPSTAPGKHPIPTNDRAPVGCPLVTLDDDETSRSNAWDHGS